jgi:hypothetical protein
MLSSDSVPGSESVHPAAAEIADQATVSQFVSFASAIGVFLLVVAAIGCLAALLLLDILAVLLSIVSGIAGGSLMLASQRLHLRSGSRAGAAQHFVNHGVSLLRETGAALEILAGQLGRVLAGLVRGILKIVVSVVSGLGAGLLTIGIFALQQPAQWDYQAIAQAGPPLGPTALGAGVSLVTTQLLLLALFYRPWRRTKAVVASSTEA